MDPSKITVTLNEEEDKDEEKKDEQEDEEEKKDKTIESNKDSKLE